MTLVEKLQDAQLFGGMDAFQDLTSWWRWLIFVKAVKGLPLDEAELAAFLYHTGRSVYTPPPGGYPEAVAIVGVQSGKSTIAGLFLGDGALEGAPGTVAIGVAQDHRGSMRTLLRYARQPFETLPMFQAEVSRDTADVLELTRGTSLGAYPCRPAAVRGSLVHGIRASLKSWDGCLSQLKNLTGRVETFIAESGWPSNQAGSSMIAPAPPREANEITVETFNL